MAKTTGLHIEWDELDCLDTDGTLAANSDQAIPSQKAVKTYVDAQGGGGGISRHTPPGAVDGMNTTFVFSPVPASAAGFFLIWNSLIVDPADYTLVSGPGR